MLVCGHLPALARAEEPKPYGDISDVKVAKPEDKLDAQPVSPPAGAIVLFDGLQASTSG